MSSQSGGIREEISGKKLEMGVKQTF